MGVEYEAKFLDIDYKKTIAKLKAICTRIAIIYGNRLHK